MISLFASLVSIAAGVMAAPTPDGHPPALPAQFTASTDGGGTGAAPYTVYVDATAKKFGKYVPGTFGTTFTVLDCVQKLKYTNAGPLPIPGLPPGLCTTSLLTAYAMDCPSIYAPTWPPTAEDTYAGYRKLLNFKDKTPCPVGNASLCDHYVYQMYPKSKTPDYEVFDFYVDSATQIDVSGTIKVGTALYHHTLKGGVDQSFLQRPASCPDPTGQCAICFTGPCGPCQQCLKIKTGACDKCWARDNATGFSCLEEDGQSLCQKCYKPPAPGPSPAPPSPTPPSPVPSDTCTTHPKCAAMGLSGACCPTKNGTYLGCCDHSAACSANPACSALGIEGDCCPTKTGTTLECCAGSGPTPPSPTPPAPAGCPGGSYASCISLCPSDPEAFKECMAECHKRCDEPPSPGPTPPSPGPSPPPSPPAPDRCDICVTGACAACKPCVSIKGGPCAPCWAKQPNGSACLPDCQDDGCWKTTFLV